MPNLTFDQDTDDIISIYSQEEISQFIDDLYMSFISHDDYNGFVGQMRCTHFRMYLILKSNHSTKSPTSGNHN